MLDLIICKVMSRTERYNFNSFEVTFGHDPLYQLETVNIKPREERENERRNFPRILINLLAVRVSQISQQVKTNTGLNVWFHLGAVTNLTDNPHKWPLSFSYQITGELSQVTPGQAEQTVIILKKRNTINLDTETPAIDSVMSENDVRAKDESCMLAAV